MSATRRQGNDAGLLERTTEHHGLIINPFEEILTFQLNPEQLAVFKRCMFKEQNANKETAPVEKPQVTGHEKDVFGRFDTPLTEFEKIILAKRHGQIDTKTFIEHLFNTQLSVLVPEGQFQMNGNKPVLVRNPNLFCITESNVTCLAMFSHPSRATPATKKYAEFRFAVTVQAGDFLMNLQPGAGLFLNPYWDVNFQWLPAQVEDMKAMMKRNSG